MDESAAGPRRIGQHHFRAKFRLRGRDRAVVDLTSVCGTRHYLANELLTEYETSREEKLLDTAGRERPPGGD
jgi:hypothetical protein